MKYVVSMNKLYSVCEDTDNAMVLSVFFCNKKLMIMAKHVATTNDNIFTFVKK